MEMGSELRQQGFDGFVQGQKLVETKGVRVSGVKLQRD